RGPPALQAPRDDARHDGEEPRVAEPAADGLHEEVPGGLLAVVLERADQREREHAALRVVVPPEDRILRRRAEQVPTGVRVAALPRQDEPGASGGGAVLALVRRGQDPGRGREVAAGEVDERRR